MSQRRSATASRSRAVGGAHRPLAALVLLVCAGAAAAQDCSTTFVGGDLAGASTLGGWRPSLSADGRRVAYTQRTGSDHAFVHDVATGQRWQADTLGDGSPMAGIVGVVSISASGWVVAFTSQDATPALGTQVYVKDLASGALQIASVMPDGTPQLHFIQPPLMGTCALSAVGGKLVFTSSAFGLVPGKSTPYRDVFVRDLAAGRTQRILAMGGAQPDGSALGWPSISADGRHVAFASRAANLVPGDTNNLLDAFVHDLATGVTERVSLAHDGQQSDRHSWDPVLSADGRHVAFASDATNLVPGDTNDFRDVFVHDRATGTTQRVSVSSAGAQANAASQYDPSISAGGERVVFYSSASNLVAGPSSGHLHVRDLAAGTTELLLDPPPNLPDGEWSSISADGATVAFSHPMPFAPGDGVMDPDVFLKACAPGAPRAYCPATPASIGCRATMSWTGAPSASAGSGFVLFTHGSISAQPGLLVYGTTSGDLRLLGTGFLCVRPPLRRSHLLETHGTPPLDCSGIFDFDFNAWIASGVDPALVAGAPVWSQFWSRDPGAAAGSHLSDAVTFLVGP